eukprot:TRINITY_DN2315_c0_g1_i1.p1 TRINITY_DN2315_c0_g1~~TRINITY_DN2315_c0_g1_i1.p1  ORF type:complete len:373 (-),score=105.42 TRINITY_DN2315_c0_g1_i1:934-1896(-)
MTTGGKPLPKFTRSGINKLFETEKVYVDDQVVKKTLKVKNGQQVRVLLQIAKEEKEEMKVTPKELPLNVVYEDEYLVVINKDCGLVVHPGEGEDNDVTLVNALVFKYGLEGLSKGENPARPGIVHRLDKDTSGLMVICKTDEVHKIMKDKFQNRKIEKEYTALVVGNMKDPQGTINGNIMRHPKIRHKMTVTSDPTLGKSATTEYKVIETYDTKTAPYNLLSINLLTGRTHQIRVHLSHLAHPIVGDVLYHKRNAKHNAKNLCLVSSRVAFQHPITEQPLEFKVDLPEHFKEFLEYLQAQESKNSKQQPWEAAFFDKDSL